MFAHNVGPDLDPNWHSDGVLKEFFEEINFEKKSADNNKSMKNYPACKSDKQPSALMNNLAFLTSFGDVLFSVEALHSYLLNWRHVMIHDRIQEDLFLSKEIITYIFLKIF